MKDTMRLAGALALAALGVQLFVTRPWQQEAVSLAAERQRLLAQEREVRRRLADLQGRAELRASAAALVGRSAAVKPGDAEVHRVRLRLVRALDVGGPSRLEVRAAPSPPAVAVASMGTSGSFETVVNLARTLAEPTAGLVFRRVSLRRYEGGQVSLQVEAEALGGGT